ncbi:hypothetical protein PMI09_00767 [Rhizobium sp. CF122]|nr:hypothetical protein PMI09_00767 [Rhizobium sp. CF122]
MLVKPLAKKKLWNLVSQDDEKAWPTENAITAVLENEGAKISRAIWDGTWTSEQFADAFKKIDAERNPINYVAFRKGTVIPTGQSSAAASGHRNTWRIGYSIPEIRNGYFGRAPEAPGRNCVGMGSKATDIEVSSIEASTTALRWSC